MAHYEQGDLVPIGATVVRTPAGWVADAGEAMDCACCGKELPLIEGEDEDGRLVASFGKDDARTSTGKQCCSESCAALLDLDVRGGLKMLETYLRAQGALNQAALAHILHERQTYALENGWNLTELIKEVMA